MVLSLAMLKRILLLPILLLCWCNLQAQDWGNVRVGAEMGFPITTDSDNLGLLFGLEPKLKVLDRAYLGLRSAVAINSQTLDNHDSTQFIFDEQFDHGFFSIIPTFDYYWYEKNFSSYIGAGIGPYSLANELDVFGRGNAPPSEREFKVKLGYRFGVLVRGGVELGLARLGMEYNFVPKTDVESPSGRKVGTVNSSYLGLTFGVILGRKNRG